MPEIAEVHRIVHYCRKHLLGRRIAAVQAAEDPIEFMTPKLGLDAKKLVAALTGRTVVDAKRQGKYFWLEMDKQPHLLMHFGMTGWMKFSHDDTGGYKPMKEKKREEEAARIKEEQGADALLAGAGEGWPPKFWKLELQFEGSPKFAAAFVDARRLGRIRLIDAPAAQMRKTTPLAENGPDPVLDTDVFTPAWLAAKLHSKKVPVKALLLDQANISGVGNWVADEALYQAKLHPEQYSNTFSDAQAAALHAAIVDVCTTACDALADSDKFPDHWIMRYRWGKGKKGENMLPNGQKIVWITVGGRTSAVVPSVQKKTGAVAGDVDDDDDKAPKEKANAGKKRKADEASSKPAVDKSKKAKKPATAVKEEEDAKPAPKTTTATKTKTEKKAASKANGKAKAPTKKGQVQEAGGRRRSARHK